MENLTTVFSLPLTRYGAYTALALLLFWAFSGMWLRHKRVRYAQFFVYALCTALFGWLISRVVFVLCSIPTYLNELDGLFTPALFFWDGGYSMLGAIFGVALGAAVAGRIARIPDGAAVNAAGFGAPMGVFMLRLAEFLCDTGESGDVGEGDFISAGFLTDLLSGSGRNLLMRADGDLCYPVCLLEAVAALAIFVVIALWLSNPDAHDMPGDVMGVFLVLFGALQVMIEPLRDDGHLTFHFVPFQQVLALAGLVVVLFAWAGSYRRHGGRGMLPVVVTILALVCIIVGVVASFMLDRSDNKVLSWALLIGPMVILSICALYTRGAKNYMAGA